MFDSRAAIGAGEENVSTFTFCAGTVNASGTISTPKRFSDIWSQAASCSLNECSMYGKQSMEVCVTGFILYFTNLQAPLQSVYDHTLRFSRRAYSLYSTRTETETFWSNCRELTELSVDQF